MRRIASLVLAMAMLMAATFVSAATPQQALMAKESKALNSSSSSSGKAEEPTVDTLVKAGPHKMDALLASMSDEQVRRLLIESLRKEAAQLDPSPASPTLVDRFDHVRERILFLRNRLVFVFSGVAKASDLLPQRLQGMLDEKGPLPVPSLILGFITLFAIWIGLKQLLYWKTKGLRERLTKTSQVSGPLFKLVRIAFKAVVEVMLLALVAVVTVAVYLALFNSHTGVKAVLFYWLIIVIILELLLLIARLFFAPRVENLRLFPLSDAAARQFYHVCQVLAVEAGIGLTLCGLLQLTGGTEAAYLLTLAATGFVVSITVILMVLWKAGDVAASLRQAFPRGTIRFQLAGSWHIITVFYVIFFWLVWVAHVVASGKVSMLPGLLTMLALPLYLLLTWTMDKVVIHAGSMASGALLKPGTEPSDPANDYAMDENGSLLILDCPVARFRRFLSKVFGFLLFVSFVIILAAIWKIDLPLADNMVRGAFSILVTLILAYFFWAFAKASIERKLRSQQPEGVAHGEPGGAGGDRLKTLLELLKRFIFVSLIVVVSLIVLTSLGVDTSPLLAGAGVVGLALGFGSQTLVKDIISGVFFLMDDAFRIGDYIDLGDARGTVEGISVRSLKLRHHRGSLYTVPYGSIKLVNNLTRDWAIMKLEYLVPFDTDIQAVKKIVKRINKELKEVPELADLMLGDVKSQGVKDIEDYGMRMRIKMTTKPGGQFTLRKWIWGKLRRYFDEAGIQFAHRKVSVVLPEGMHNDHDTLQQVSAAAAEGVQEQLEREEAEKNKHKG